MSKHLLENAQPHLETHRQKHSRQLSGLFAEGQDPNVFFITCADSRLLPEQMLGLNPGDFFIVRNVANIVPPAHQQDASLAAALEFAFFELQVSDIVICGHTDCGGLKALDQGLDDQRFRSLQQWLEQAQSSAPATDSAVEDPILARPAHHVAQQLANLQSYPYIAQALADGRLRTHGWVYDIRDASVYTFDPDNSALAKFQE